MRVLTATPLLLLVTACIDSSADGGGPDANDYQVPACAPVAEGTPTVLAQAMNRPTALIPHGDYLYFSDFHTDLSNHGGRIYRVARAGGDVELLVERASSDGLANLELLAVDDTTLYWYEAFGEEGIYRTPIAGGDVVRLGGDPSMITPAVDQHYAYFGASDEDGIGVARIAFADGNFEALAIDYTSPPRAVDDDFVYGGHLSGVWRAPKTGGDTVTLATLDVPEVFALTLDDEHVYYSSVEGILRVPKSGGQPTLVFGTPLINRMPFIAVDDTHVYFEWGPDNRISRVSKAGGEDPVDLYCDTELDYVFVSDGDQLLWFEGKNLMVAPK